MNTYLAITIGPIYKTMTKARKTRELWISSYFFSDIMKQIFNEAKKYGNILLPVEKDKNHEWNGAGIYPDRLIMILDNPTLNVQIEIIDRVINAHKNYINIHFIVANTGQLDAFKYNNEKDEPITSVIHKLNYLLDVKELNQNYQSCDEDFFTGLFGYKNLKKCYKDAFDNKHKKFRSVFDITTQHSDAINTFIANHNLSEDSEENDLEDKLLENKEFTSKLVKHEKYLAILRADGDNFGKVISALGNDSTKLTNFSTDLVTYSKEAVALIHNFGGAIIYIGGDDILALCPIKKNNKETIFNLVEDLNTAFYEVFKSDDYKKHKVSLSYGVSISYYKYPLNEALDTSFSLLMNKAKKQPFKNCIATKLLLHSGTEYETILTFDEQEKNDTINHQNYYSFISMLTEIKDKDAILQSLTHQLFDDKVLLIEVLKNKDRYDAYFTNHFNPAEKKEEVRVFIKTVQTFLWNTKEMIIKNNEALKAQDKKDAVIGNVEQHALEQLHIICKIVNFLNTENE